MKKLLVFVLVCVVALPALADPAPEKRFITAKDLLKFQWVADPQISPDGKRVAYVLVAVNDKGDGYDASLWLVETDGASAPRRLTVGPRDSAPRWSPDSQTLAFLRAGEREAAQIYLLPMSGGEGMKLTDLPRGMSPAVWSPSGKTIVFSSTTTAQDIAERRKPSAEKKSDVRVITRAVYRANGAGWLDPTHPAHIWTIEIPSGVGASPEPKQITSGRYSEGGPQWSRDGNRIYFIANRVDEPYYNPPDSNLYSIPAAGGELQTVIDIDGPVGGAAASPDGARFAFAGFLNPGRVQSHTMSRLFVFANGKPVNLTPNAEFEVGSGIIGDQHAPRGGSPEPLVWTPDGRAVITAVTEHGSSNLARVDTTTAKIEPLTTGNHDVMSYTATPDASKFALAISDATHVGDVYVLDTATKKLKQLTHVNDDLFPGLRLSEPEDLWYTSFDGRKVETWVLKPPDFDPAKKYPLILDIHGGPHTAYGWTFFHEFQWMAAKGYVVVYPNPRGSTTYGQEFANIIQYKYPGDDFKDLMLAVDEVLKRGYIDEKRMGVTGGSGGGLLTNWAITQTGRFAAAVSQRSVANWASFWYTADFTLFTPSWFRSTPFRDPEEFDSRSPVRYAEKITTPLMLVEGDDDLRAPPSQGGEAMFRALKAQHTTAVMVRFPGETHELSRSGRPTHRIERLEHILNWFDKYLQGKDSKLYELQ